MRTKEQNTQYQKDRRARLAEESRKVTFEKVEEVFDAFFPKAEASGHFIIEGDRVVQTEPLPPATFAQKVTKVSKRAAAVVVVEDGRASVREFKGGSGYHYLPGDDVIGKMTQKQRDALLNKLPKTPSRTR